MITTISGFKELDAALKQMTVDLEKKLVRAALRDAAKITQDRLKAKLYGHQKSGRMLASVRVTTRVDKRRGRVKALVRVGGKYKGQKIWYSHFLEGGTKAHEIRPKGRKSLFFAGVFKTVIKHPGVKPRRHVRNSLIETESQVIDRVRIRLGQDINRHARKTLAATRAAARVRSR